MEDVGKEVLCITAEKPKNYSEQRQNASIRGEVSKRMGKKEELRSLRSLGRRKICTLVFALVFEMVRMHKEEGRGPNPAFI